MCFSATASFIAAGFLLLASITIVKITRRRQALMLGVIPLLFAIQQTAEGIIWHYHNQPDYWLYSYAVYIFLGFALIIWPLWVQLSLLLIEKSDQKRRLLGICASIGFLFGVIALILLSKYGATAHIVQQHIFYDLAFYHQHELVATAVYFLCTVLPFFITSIPYLWMYGVAIALLYLISFLFWHAFIVSVWCFFAALLSLTIYAALKTNRDRIT